MIFEQCSWNVFVMLFVGYLTEKTFFEQHSKKTKICS